MGNMYAASPTTSPSEEYTSQNHPTNTGSHVQALDMDHRPVARQKRKRTSPEDQEILEAAYKRDPKPDKAARLELVKQVALGEKEVQIWFQNRRQSCRRKSRPLLPHEIAQYQMARERNAASPSLNTEGLVRYESGVDVDDSRDDSPECSTASDTASSSSPKDDKPEPQQSHDPLPTIQQASHDHDTTSSRNSSRPDSRNMTGSADPIAESVSESARMVGYLADRSNTAPIRHSLSAQSYKASPVPERLDRQLRKASSFVRLSMNAEGKAEIITKDAASPSPPRPRQTMLLADAAPSSGSTSRSFNTSGLQRSFSGRASDSRAWEFWCDKEARSELGSAAAKESSGSAAGAIGLLRTASGRNILGSLSAKRNSGFTRQVTSAKRTKLDMKRAPLQRSSTSMGRLQSKHLQSHATLPKLKHSNSASSFHVKDNDSDKENWSPNGDENSDSQDFDRPSESRAIGQDNASGHQRGRGDIVSGATEMKSKRFDNDPEADAELAAFMGGGRKSEDLDCVQGLLSLSQGNWR